MATKQKQTHKAGTMKQTKKTNTQTGKSKTVYERVKQKKWGYYTPFNSGLIQTSGSNLGSGTITKPHQKDIVFSLYVVLWWFLIDQIGLYDFSDRSDVRSAGLPGFYASGR